MLDVVTLLVDVASDCQCGKTKNVVEFNSCLRKS